MGLDIEYNCLPYSATQQCTKCGSWHTMPKGYSDSSEREFYEWLWKREDETGNHNVTCAYRIDELEKCLKKCDEWNSTDHTIEFEEEDKGKEPIKKETFLDQCGIAIILILYIPFYLYDCIKEKFRSGKSKF